MYRMKSLYIGLTFLLVMMPFVLSATVTSSPVVVQSEALTVDQMKMMITASNADIKTYCAAEVQGVKTWQEEFSRQVLDDAEARLKAIEKDLSRRVVLGVLAGCLLGWSIAALSSVAFKKKMEVF